MTQSSGAKRRENVDSYPLSKSDVGWVERSETHHRAACSIAMGFAALYPSYGIVRHVAPQRRVVKST